MKKKITLIVVLVLLLAILIGAYILYDKYSEEYAPDNLAVEEPKPQSEPTEPPKETASAEEPDPAPSENLAPDFTVLDASQNPITLSEHFGKPIVINFWATWCPYCVSELPTFQEIYKAFGDDVQFMMVNATASSGETLESAQSHIQEYGYTFPVYYDTTGEASNTYGAHALPLTFFINAKGEVVAYGSGAIGGKTLLKGIATILD